MACSTRGWQRRITVSPAVQRLTLRGGEQALRVERFLHRHGQRLPSSFETDEVLRTFEGPPHHPDILVLESQCWPSGRLTHHLELNRERVRFSQRP